MNCYQKSIKKLLRLFDKFVINMKIIGIKLLINQGSLLSILYSLNLTIWNLYLLIFLRKN